MMGSNPSARAILFKELVVDKLQKIQHTLDEIKHDLENNEVGYYFTYEEAQQIFEGKFQKLYFVDRETGQTVTFYLEDADIV